MRSIHGIGRHLFEHRIIAIGRRIAAYHVRLICVRWLPE